MASHTLSTADKELLLKMVGVLIRTNDYGFLGGEGWYTAVMGDKTITTTLDYERCVNTAFRKIIGE